MPNLEVTSSPPHCSTSQLSTTSWWENSKYLCSYIASYALGGDGGHKLWAKRVKSFDIQLKSSNSENSKKFRGTPTLCMHTCREIVSI